MTEVIPTETIISNIVVAALALVGTLAGTYAANRKATALLEYRLRELEDKVAKHNNLVERTYKLEGEMTEVQHDIRDLKAK